MACVSIAAVSLATPDFTSPWVEESTCSFMPFPQGYPRPHIRPTLSTFCLFRQDVSEDLKFSLNTRIELALADQGWEALAAQLRMNDHLNVRFVPVLTSMFLACTSRKHSSFAGVCRGSPFETIASIANREKSSELELKRLKFQADFHRLPGKARVPKAVPAFTASYFRSNCTRRTFVCPRVLYVLYFSSLSPPRVGDRC